MSEENFIQKIFRLLKAGKPPSPSQTAASQDSTLLSKLLQMVENTDPHELSCDEVFELLDQYVEAEARREDVARILPLVNRHLDRCRDCLEEYQALLRMIEAASQIESQGR